MAKMKFDPNMGTNHTRELELNYSGEAFVLGTHGATKAVYADSSNEFSITFSGEKLKYSDGALTSGTVEHILFFDAEGEKLAVIDGLHAKAASLYTRMNGEGGVGELLALALRQADTILGTAAGEDIHGESGRDILRAKGGDDGIYANRGGDTMFGGSGNDTFLFFGDCGKAVIKDFDLGDEGSFDTMYLRDVGFQIHKAANNDVRFDFEDGSSVLLEGVKFKDRSEIHIDAVL